VIILDTDMLSIVQRGRGTAFEILSARLAQESSPIFATIVSFEEQMRGWLAQIARARSMESQISAYSRLHMLVNDYMEYTILDFDIDAAHVFARLRKARIRIGTMDLRIAAIALANSAMLVSRNLNDFEKVPGLDVQDWTREES
jgi:tRNA(fMet)-specific endonuclease VapC